MTKDDIPKEQEETEQDEKGEEGKDNKHGTEVSSDEEEGDGDENKEKVSLTTNITINIVNRYLDNTDRHWLAYQDPFKKTYKIRINMHVMLFFK